FRFVFSFLRNYFVFLKKWKYFCARKKIEYSCARVKTILKIEISDVKNSSEVQASARDFAMLVIDNGITPPIVEANLIAIGQSYKQTINYTNIMKGVGEIIKGAIRTSRWGKKQTEAGVGMIIDGIITTVDGAKNVKSFEGHLGQRSNSGLLLDGIKTVELKSNNVTSITMYSASALQTSGRKYWSSTARTVSGYHLSTLIPCGTRGTDGGCYTTGAAAWMAGSVETPQIHQAFIDDVNSFYYLR